MPPRCPTVPSGSGQVLSTFGVAVLFGALVLIVAAWPEGPEYLLAVRFLRSVWVLALVGTFLYIVALSAAVRDESFGSGLNPGGWLDLFDAGVAGQAALARPRARDRQRLGRAATRTRSSTRRPSCRPSPSRHLPPSRSGCHAPPATLPRSASSPALPMPSPWPCGSVAWCCWRGSCWRDRARKTSSMPCAVSGGSPDRPLWSPSSAGSSSCTDSMAARCSASATAVCCSSRPYSSPSCSSSA